MGSKSGQTDSLKPGLKRLLSIGNNEPVQLPDINTSTCHRPSVVVLTIDWRNYAHYSRTGPTRAFGTWSGNCGRERLVSNNGYSCRRTHSSIMIRNELLTRSSRNSGGLELYLSLQPSVRFDGGGYKSTNIHLSNPKKKRWSPTLKKKIIYKERRAHPSASNAFTICALFNQSNLRDLKHSRPGSDSLVRHGRVATCEHNVRLTGDGGGALGCSGDDEGESAVNGGGSDQMD